MEPSFALAVARSSRPCNDDGGDGHRWLPKHRTGGKFEENVKESAWEMFKSTISSRAAAARTQHGRRRFVMLGATVQLLKQKRSSK